MNYFKNQSIFLLNFYSLLIAAQIQKPAAIKYNKNVNILPFFLIYFVQRRSTIPFSNIELLLITQTCKNTLSLTQALLQEVFCSTEHSATATN